MRVGIDVRVANAPGAGQQRYLWRLGEWLAGRGHDVHYLTVKPQVSDVSLSAGTTLHRYSDLGRSDLSRAIEGLGLDVLLLNPERSRTYRGIPANVLRSAYGTDQYRQKLRSFHGAFARLGRIALRGAPWVLIERSWERAFYRQVDPAPRVIAQSRYMKAEIVDTYPISAGRVRVIYNGVDTKEFCPATRAQHRAEMRRRWGIPQDAFCLLLMAHNYRLKGLWQLLRVLPEFVERGDPIHLLVAGKGTGAMQRKKARRLIRRLGLEGHVTLAGPVTPSAWAHAASDTLVHLSWHDSFGFVVLESLACGVPVITTPYVGASELVVEGDAGLVVDPAVHGEIASAISALRDPSTREEYGRRGVRVGEANSEEANFRQVLDVLESAASDRADR